MADKAQTPQLKELAPEDPEALIALGSAAPLSDGSLYRMTNVLGWLLAGLIVWLSYALVSRLLGPFAEQAESKQLRPPSVELKGLDELYRSMEREKKNPLYTEGVDKLKGQLSKTESQLQEMIENAKPRVERSKKKILGDTSAGAAGPDMERF